MLIDGREKAGTKRLKNLKAFVDYLETTYYVHENLKDYNPIKKRKVSLLFDDMMADMEANKKLNPLVTALFLRSRKFNI